MNKKIFFIGIAVLILVSIIVSAYETSSLNEIFSQSFSIFGFFKDKFNSFKSKNTNQESKIIPQQKQIKQEVNELTMDNALNNCKSLNLQDTAYCLNKEIKKIYRYNYERLGYGYPEETYYQRLKEEGGVCDQWAKLYEIMAKRLGFNTEQVIIFDEEKSFESIRHSILIIYNNEGYCIMDQTSYWCNHVGE